ncbi:unnamed protein product [Cyclocybe aegerita]|uniref:Uncharacterized protein n=1 Tax=Cyclocybe aegerita TaxID=1973307 RepID=A0A8S0VSU4_CYCAE|nr:unnamed protein product [Cyclocybe aegerita]
MLHEGPQSPPSSVKRSPVMHYPLPSDDPRVELAAVEAEVTKVSMVLAALVHKTHMLKERINHLHSPILRILPPGAALEDIPVLYPTIHAHLEEDCVEYAVPLEDVDPQHEHTDDKRANGPVGRMAGAFRRSPTVNQTPFLRRQPLGPTFNSRICNRDN